MAPHNSDPSLAAEVAELRSRLAALEAERAEQAARARRRRKVALGALGLAALTGTIASAANGNCPNGLPVCFSADTAAQASQVNLNFMQLKEWLETKVGSTASNGVTASTITASGLVTANGGLRAHSTSSVAPPASAGRSAWITGNTTSYDAPIFEVRHDNLTQGVAIGWNSILATGTATDQNLYMKPKGSGVVEIQGNLLVNGTIGFPNRPCRALNTACQTQGGGEAIYLDRHDVACDVNEYLRRFRLQPCNGGMYYQFTCCPI